MNDKLSAVQKFIRDRVMPKNDMYGLIQQYGGYGNVPEQAKRENIDEAMNFAMMGSTAPASAGEKSARMLSDIMERGGQLNIPQTGKLMELVNMYLKRIPAKIRSRMTDEQLLSEIQGLFAKKR